MAMFEQRERDLLRRQLIQQAEADARLVGAAAVGSSAGDEDRWSDLDLTFAVADDVPISAVLDDWTQDLVGRFHAAVLFDLSFLASIYRVFLLPGALQVDLSFTPAAEFGPHGPRFRLLFGNTVERSMPAGESREHVFGLAVHHAVRCRICLERDRLWQAEFWLHELRDEVLKLGCFRLALETSYGRGFDRLPGYVLESLGGCLPDAIEKTELRRALGVTVQGLVREADDILARQPPWLRRDLVELSHSDALRRSEAPFDPP